MIYTRETRGSNYKTSNQFFIPSCVYTIQGFNAVVGVLNVFPKEKVIVGRERDANAYDTFS